MAEERVFVGVKNWDRFQQYKDGRTIHWVKLHVALRSDYDFMSLPEVTRYHLMMIWTVAPQLGNRIPLDETFLAREIHADSPIDLETLVLGGWLVPLDDATVERACKYLSNRNVRSRTNSYELVSLARSREGETETEEDTEGSSLRSSPSGRDPDEKGSSGEEDPWSDPKAVPKREVGARYLPLIRPLLHANGVPAGYADRRALESSEVSVCRAMLKRGVPPEDLEDAIMGLAWLRDHGALEFVEKGQTVTTRAIYDPAGKRESAVSLLRLSADAAKKHGLTREQMIGGSG